LIGSFPFKEVFEFFESILANPPVIIEQATLIGNRRPDIVK